MNETSASLATEVSKDLSEFADKLLAGTGLTVQQAIKAASGAEIPTAAVAAVEALRDGWRMAEGASS